MSKRARTSGLGDVKPQILTLSTVAAAVDDYAVDSIALPVARIGGAKTKAVVFEILSVDWYLDTEGVGDITHSAAGYLSTGTSGSRLTPPESIFGLTLPICQQ